MKRTGPLTVYSNIYMYISPFLIYIIYMYTHTYYFFGHWEVLWMEKFMKEAHNTDFMAFGRNLGAQQWYSIHPDDFDFCRLCYTITISAGLLLTNISFYILWIFIKTCINDFQLSFNMHIRCRIVNNFHHNAGG